MHSERARSEWERRRQQFVTLYRVFLTRVVDLELLSKDADTTRLVGQFVTIFAFFSFWFSLLALLFGTGMPQTVAWRPEHFFIATTMLVVGAVSVMAWDSAFPDGRDALVLAPLPVRMSTLFAAKVAALFSAPGLAIVSLNVFTGLTWPLVFGYHQESFVHGLRAWPAYWMTMAAAGVFLFCSLLTLQGVLANVLPRQMFLRLSALLQAGILCGLLCVYLLEPSLESTRALLAPGNQRELAWLPTYWFLGLFQQLNGSMRPEFVPLVRRAWVGLGASVLGAGVALLLSYFRMLPKIVEQPEIMPVVRGFTLPDWLGGGLKQAMTMFSLRTLMRSRQHRMILSFYLGIGLAIVVAYGKTSEGDVGIATTGIPVTSLLASVLMMLLAVLALRSVAAMPISLKANWMVRLTQVRPEREYRRAVRVSWLVLTVTPVLMVVAGSFLVVYPPEPVLMHLALLLAIGVLAVEMCLATFPKVSFACSYLPGNANVHFVFWATLAGMILLLRKALDFEERMLLRPFYFGLLVATLASVAVGVALVTETRSRAADELVFEEEYGEQIVTLNLR
jgi:hypothetical protein